MSAMAYSGCEIEIAGYHNSFEKTVSAVVIRIFEILSLYLLISSLINSPCYLWC